MFLRLIRSLLLPFVVTVVIPASLLTLLPPPARSTSQFLNMTGLPLIAAGLILLVTCVRLFMIIGKGTLAPWDPPKKLVTEGPYRFVRNPMITGVVAILLGESLWFSSWPLIAWTLIFSAVKVSWFICFEEPEMAKQFGVAYHEYRKKVPRFIPRIKVLTGSESGPQIKR